METSGKEEIPVDSKAMFWAIPGKSGSSSERWIFLNAKVFFICAKISI